MKTTILALAIIFLPFLVWGQPAIDFPTVSHDFGEVQRGGPLEHSFEFMNKGKGELIIMSLASS